MEAGNNIRRVVKNTVGTFSAFFTLFLRYDFESRPNGRTERRVACVHDD